MSPLNRSAPLAEHLKQLWHSATRRVISVTFLGMVLALAMDVLLAARLGPGPTTDALVLALSLPTTVELVLREGTRLSLVPLFVAEESAQLARFTSGLVNLALLGGVLLAAGIALAAWPLVQLLGPGLAEPKLAATMLQLAAPAIACAPACSILGAYLNCRGRFSRVALRNAAAPALVVAVLLVAGHLPSAALFAAAAYGTGYLLYLTWLLYSAGQTGHLHDWRVLPRPVELQPLWQAGALPSLGFLADQGAQLVVRQLLTLQGSGILSAYYFGYRLYAASQGLIGSSVATVSMPLLAREERKAADLAPILARNMQTVLMAALPLVFVLVLSSREVVRLLYGWGTFDAVAVEQTATVLTLLAPGIAFNCLFPVLMAGVLAVRAFGSALLNQVLAAGMAIGLAWSLGQMWGLAGIALATSLTVFATDLHLLYLLHRLGVLRRLRSKPHA